LAVWGLWKKMNIKAKVSICYLDQYSRHPNMSFSAFVVTGELFTQGFRICCYEMWGWCDEMLRYSHRTEGPNDGFINNWGPSHWFHPPSESKSNTSSGNCVLLLVWLGFLTDMSCPLAAPYIHLVTLPSRQKPNSLIQYLHYGMNTKESLQGSAGRSQGCEMQCIKAKANIVLQWLTKLSLLDEDFHFKSHSISQ
jgi:hypothetical protein